MRKFVIGDIHGNAKGLLSCLSKIRFDYENDLLICIGDLCDSKEKSDTYKVLLTLLKIKNLILIKGNHDVKLIKYFKDGKVLPNWIKIGGQQTLDSFKGKDISIFNDLINSFKNYHIEDDILFCHAGANSKKLISKTSVRTLHSTRTFWRKAKALDSIKKKFKLKEYPKSNPVKEIIIGHSPVNSQPERRSNVINVDVKNALTIMNIHTKKFWQE